MMIPEPIEIGMILPSFMLRPGPLEFGLLLIVIIGPLYFLPTIVALVRHHRNRLSIIILNLLVGWTFIGWVIALVWAFTHDVIPSKSLSE